MVKRYDITFHEASAPIARLVTKFGGQPAWATPPQWPVSASTGAPMRFICQIALDEPVFGDLAGRMAYLFMTDTGATVLPTWEPESGENALIIQPGRYDKATQPLTLGPALETWRDQPGGHLRAPHAIEYAVTLTPGDDPDVFADIAEDVASGGNWTGGNKVGGAPAFLQGPEYPAGGPWKLVLQLDSADVPFDVNFGDAGLGYAFISTDGQTGRFLWQGA